MMKCHVRWCVRRDLPEVLAIERASYQEESAWTEEDFLTALRQRNVIGMVAEVKDKVVGYMVYSLEAKRLTLMNLAVSPDFRRLGVGTALVNKLASKLHSHRRTRIRIDVGDDNLAAHLFLKASGFSGMVLDRESYRFVYHVLPVAELIENVEEISV